MSTIDDQGVTTDEAVQTAPETAAKAATAGSRARGAARSGIAEPLAADEDDEEEDEEGAATAHLDDEEESELVEEEDEEGEGIVVTLNADLRRRLRRRAEREGVEPEELAEELLAAAIRRPVAQSLVDVLARLDKLERRVSDLAAARHTAEPAPPPRREERPRTDFGRGGYGERRNDRGGFGGGDRGYGQRSQGGGFRGERRYDDRPRGGYGDRGFDRGERGYDRGGEREGYRERPGRHWEAPRRGE